MATSVPETDSVEKSESQGGPKFVPQLYIQRYGYIQNVLHQNHVKSVVDFGSAQCKIVTLLKTVPCLEKISLVDMDKALLEANTHCIKPLLYEFLQRRATPLTIRVFHGDATRLDERLMDCDAVTMVEFIEHLITSDLEQVVQRVFSDIAPRLVVLTTPNADFNALFPDFSGVRHWDHKFEWSRKEFQTWCERICEKYGYTVAFNGVGDPPEDSLDLGHCSQAAVFTRTNQSKPVRPTVSQCFTMISEVVYPHKQEQLSKEEKMALEVQYWIHYLASQGNDDDADDDDNVYAVIHINRLLDFRQVREICDIDKLRSYLRSCYRISEDGERVFVPVDSCEYRDDETVELDDETVEMDGHSTADCGEIVTDKHCNRAVETCEDSWD